MHLHPPLPVVLATAAVAAYTAVTWWVCRPLLRAWVRRDQDPRR